jgi:NAD(P)-dependent dehydrogenase (short-subunit alcohol dehydrogenase family)
MGQRTALVTGASSGIGAAACRRLREEGWRVTGLARTPSPDADASQCVDIANFAAVQDAVSNLRDLQLLVHCAAVIGPVSALAETDPKRWHESVSINFLGTYNILRSALAGPLNPEGSIVIHLTTGAAAVAKPYWSAYSSAKAGAEHLIRSAAIEVEGTDVAVCALDPGLTETPMQEEIRALEFPGHERFVHAHVERRAHSPEQVADAVWELSQREPAALNGRTFRVGQL